MGDGPLNFKTTLDVDSFLISDLSIAQTNWLAQSASAFCKQGAKKTEIRIAADWDVNILYTIAVIVNYLDIIE